MREIPGPSSIGLVFPRLAGEIATMGLHETIRRSPVVILFLAIAILSRPAWGREDRDRERDDGSFGMTRPVACREVKGYEDYEVLPESRLTSDEKLVVYFKPIHYKSARKGDQFEASFTLEGKIRRKGETAVIWTKKDMKYKVASDKPPQLIYLTNTVSLKTLKPGDYQYEMTLRDEVGQPTPAVRTLPFTIRAAGIPEPSSERQSGPDRP